MRGRHGIGLLCLAGAGCHLVFPHQQTGGTPAGDGIRPEGPLPDRAGIRAEGPLPDRSDACTSATDCGPGTEGGVTPPLDKGSVVDDGGSVVDAPVVRDSGGCSGCWASSVCVPGNTEQACGRGGAVCSSCNMGAVCVPP